jgi:hypothetical protein
MIEEAIPHVGRVGDMFTRKATTPAMLQPYRMERSFRFRIPLAPEAFAKRHPRRSVAQRRKRRQLLVRGDRRDLGEPALEVCVRYRYGVGLDVVFASGRSVNEGSE